MGGIEEQLGPLLDSYSKFEESNAKRQDQLRENQNFKNAFNQLAENIIRPEMNKYAQILDKKGFRSSIFHETGHQIGHLAMSLSFSYGKPLYSDFTPPLIPALKFAAENGKISVYENKFGPSGLSCSGKEGSYETYQITASFVEEKLLNFFKSLFDKKWDLSVLD